MTVKLTPEAQKQYQNLPDTEKAKIKKKLLLLGAQPLAGKKLTGKFKELRSLKAWPYRIIYWIDKQKNPWVVSILHRQGAYK